MHKYDYVKHIIVRVRPCDINRSVSLLISRPNDCSLSSSHTFASLSTVIVLYLVDENKLWKIFLIVFSRMYLYVYYLDDIIGEIVIGSLCGYMGYSLFNILFQNTKFKKIIESIFIKFTCFKY